MWVTFLVFVKVQSEEKSWGAATKIKDNKKVTYTGNGRQKSNRWRYKSRKKEYKSSDMFSTVLFVPKYVAQDKNLAAKKRRKESHVCNFSILWYCIPVSDFHFQKNLQSSVSSKQKRKSREWNDIYTNGSKRTVKRVGEDCEKTGRRRKAGDENNSAENCQQEDVRHTSVSRRLEKDMTLRPERPDFVFFQEKDLNKVCSQLFSHVYPFLTFLFSRKYSSIYHSHCYFALNSEDEEEDVLPQGLEKMRIRLKEKGL